MEAYLDNSATTRVAEDVIELMTKVMREDFGNPSSKHMMGVDSENYLREAAGKIAKILKVDASAILFTSGGTESNNMALIGSAMANRRAGNHIITTAIEHASVLEPLKYLEKNGFEITFLTVDENGHISLDELEKAIKPETIIVSTMMVNNEIGALQDVKAIGSLIKKKNPAIIYHVDAIQGFGKYEIRPLKMNIDLLSVSGHKLHGPKGVGFLYINPKIKINPLILGGGQQKGMRSGTDNVPGIAGLGLAAENAYKNLEANVSHMTALKDRMTEKLEELAKEFQGLNGINIKINSKKGSGSAPHIVSCTFFPVKSEVLLHALEEAGIYVSSGSACSSNKPGLSGTLQSIGLTPKEADCTLRFSFAETTSEEEIDWAAETLKELVPVLAKFTSH